MTKAPRVGQVKTRLTPPLTPEEATALNRCFLRDITGAISLTVGKGLARGLAIYTPVGAAAEYDGIIPADFQLLPQRGEKLEERLIFALEDLFQRGFTAACLINSDSPTIPQRVFAEAAIVLAQPEDAVVLGPSSDGGYYLIGLKNLHPTLFENIAWSTRSVLQQTCERARQINLKIHLLPTWYDVDDSVTLRRLCDELFGTAAGTHAGYPAPATRAYLEELLRREGRARIWPMEERR